MHCLDTSAVIELLYGTKKGTAVQQLVLGKPLAITSITVHELMVGLKQTEINQIENFLKEISILPFDVGSAYQSAQLEKELRAKGTLINKIDILIAGICVHHNFMLVTCDQGFERIKTLNVSFF